MVRMLTVVDHDGYRAGFSNFNKEGLQRRVVESTSKVATRNDDGVVGTRFSRLSRELNGLTSASSPSSNDERDLREAVRVQDLTSSLDEQDALCWLEMVRFTHRSAEKNTHPSLRHRENMTLESGYICAGTTKSVGSGVSAWPSGTRSSSTAASTREGGD